MQVLSSHGTSQTLAADLPAPALKDAACGCKPKALNALLRLWLALACKLACGQGRTKTRSNMMS